MQLQNAVGSALSNHMQVIWYNFLAICVLSFCYVICAIAGAANSSSKTYSFVVIWTMLLMLAYTVGGGLVVRYPKYRSQLSVGFLIGVSVMIINLLLITAIISGANFADFGLTGPGYDPKSSTQAVTAFASLLLIAEVFFTVFVTLYRDTLLPPPAMASTDGQAPLPPTQFSTGAGATATSGYGGAAASSGYGGNFSSGYGGEDSYSTDKGYSTEPVAPPSSGAVSGPGVL